MSPHAMIEGSSVAAVISDPHLPDTPIIACNEAFVALTGYAQEEVVGRNCRFLRGPDTEADLTDELRRAVQERRTTLVEILNYRKDGTPFRNAVMLAPIFDADGALRYILGSQYPVSADNPASPSRDAIARLSTRQRDVLVRMAAGRMNKQIAYELQISERTVKMHRAALLKALGCRTAAEAIRAAVEAGL
ncbi:PAS domain-containing protein [Sphingomonas sp. IC-11]|uniref:LuxR C-terminal-related transcriptional regulator n=1 Tax=Sphingomonas sp. IC-11 TaxID=2898528 RepID=UPI001E480DDB|nr:LuxR C-terminal-related transcriptional regulator [Sphingomonas sp. IC-11]MCD2317323.1 PAS domain-containing protein [Sphingomonas sp. IC-11]